MKTFGIFSLSIVSFFVIWSLTIIAKYSYTTWSIVYWLCQIVGVIISLILYVLISSLYIRNPLFITNVEHNAVLTLFQIFWMSFNFSDSSLMFYRFVKNIFQWKFFSFVDLRIGYVSISVYKSHPLATVEPLYDGFNCMPCVSNISFWLGFDLTFCRLFPTTLVSSDYCDIVSSIFSLSLWYLI